MLTDEQKKVLVLVEEDKIYWTRTAPSEEYLIHRTALKQLISKGLVVPVRDSCYSCWRGYLLTTEGERALCS